MSPDLIHLHSSKAGLVGRLVARGRLVTVFQPNAWSFFAARGLLRRLAIGWECWAARWTSAIVCVSEDERRCGRDVGIDARFVVVPNGTQVVGVRFPGDADRQRAKRDLCLGENPLVVCVGRLHEQKGQDVLLDAWDLVSAEMPEARLVLVGEGSTRTLLEERARRPSVSLVGNRTDVATWLEAADVVAVPSRWEGHPLVTMEAMVRGRSVVATEACGMAEGLSGAGALVPVEDPTSLATAIVGRLSNPTLAADEGLVGRTHVEKFYDVRRTTAEMARTYDGLLAVARSARVAPL